MGLFGFLKQQKEEDPRTAEMNAFAKTLVSDEEINLWWGEMNESERETCNRHVAEWEPARRELARRLIIKFYHLDIGRVKFMDEWRPLKAKYQELDKLRMIDEAYLKTTRANLEEAKEKMSTLREPSPEYYEQAKKIVAMENYIQECEDGLSEYAVMPEMRKKMDDLTVRTMALTEEIKKLHKEYPDIFAFTGYGEKGY